MAARIPGTTELNPFLEPVPILPTSYSTCLSTSFTQSQTAPHFVAQTPIAPILTYQISPFPTSSSFGIGSNSSGGWMNKGTMGNENVWGDVGGAYKIGKINAVDKMDESPIDYKNEPQECPVSSNGECVPLKLDEESVRTEISPSHGTEKNNCSNKSEGKINVDKTSTASLQPDGDSDLENNQMHKDLPEELLVQFSARRCELCVVQMNSALQSKMHYNGKQHQKKVRLFMNNWYKEHGEPNSKKIRKDFSLGPPKIPDDKRLYCECCDLSFTSMLHAQQHYMGRNHQRVVSGQQPLRSGYFNKSTHRWQRFPPWNELTKFGLDKILPPDLHNPEILMPEKTNGKQEDQDAKKGRFFCELCNIGATSQEQLDMHFKGGKHKKAEKLVAQSERFSDDFDIDRLSSQTPPADSILASVIKTKEGTSQKRSKGKDYSIYRTPSGKFYCQPCNLTVHCESQFIQHLDSKKHKCLLGQKKGSGGNRYSTGNSKCINSFSHNGTNSFRKNGVGSFSFLQSISSMKSSLCTQGEDNQYSWKT